MPFKVLRVGESVRIDHNLVTGINARLLHRVLRRRQQSHRQSVGVDGG